MFGVKVLKTVSLGPALNVEWTLPQSDLPITECLVYYSSNGSSGNTFIAPHNATNVTLSSLVEGTLYSVRVRARSAIGLGNWSDVQYNTTYRGMIIMVDIFLAVFVDTRQSDIIVKAG